MNRLLFGLALVLASAAVPDPPLIAQDNPESPAAIVEQPPAKRAPLTFFQIVFSGGPLGIANMVVLIGLSIAALAVAVDNLRVIRKSRLIPPGLSDDVRSRALRGDLGGAAVACQEQPSLLAAVIARGLSEASGGWSEIEKAMEESLAEQAAKLFRRIEYLSVIGNIAPMVGLLGTVTGMLLAFKQVADTEGTAGAQLADGIYQALVTTVVGLIIAIPSLGAFALMRSRVDELVAEAAYAALHALSPLKQAGSTDKPPVVSPPPPPGTR